MTPTMADFAEISQRMDQFRASDLAREQFVSELLAKYHGLLEEFSNVKGDWLSERDIRKVYQKSAGDNEILVNSLQRQLESSSFVLALIDGDGAIFQDALLQAANGDGGSEAATRLNNAIREHVASIYSNSGNWPVMVQIYLSLEKLAIKLAQVGLLRNQQDMRIFAQRFSVNQPLFNIVDVGHGKERADHKIKEMLRTFSDNPTCRHIIFAGCHDAGYLLNLDQFKHITFKAGRFTLLETTTALPGYEHLSNFKRARFDDVFKSEPLPDYALAPNNRTRSPVEAPAQVAVQAPVQAPVRAPKQTPVQTPVEAPVQASVQSPVQTPAVSRSNTSPVTTSKSAVSAPSPSSTPVSAVSNGDTSYGQQAAPVREIAKPATRSNTNNSTTGKKKYAYYNKAEHRLDEPLPAKDPNAAASLEARMKRTGKKMCNHWHLGGHCENGKFCSFQHEPRLNPGELNALRYKTRSTACKDTYCENIDCYLGHQCALERDYGYCRYPENCNFRSTHGMDRVKYVRYDADGNSDYAP